MTATDINDSPRLPEERELPVYFGVKMASEMTGVSHQSFEKYVPPDALYPLADGRLLPLFTPETVETYRVQLSTLRPGRPRKNRATEL